MDAKRLTEIINAHNPSKINEQQAYYLGKNPALLLPSPKPAPDYRVPVPFARIAVDNMAGYLVAPGAYGPRWKVCRSSRGIHLLRPALLDRIPTFRKWPSYADSARPETISYMNRHGYQNMKAVQKWPGSVEDGIEYLKSFDRIIINPRCKHVAEEFSLYRYKTDRQTGEILPLVVDADNHYIDALRYALSRYITAKRPGVASPSTRHAFGYG